MRKDKVSKNL